MRGVGVCWCVRGRVDMFLDWEARWKGWGGFGRSGWRCGDRERRSLGACLVTRGVESKREDVRISGGSCAVVTETEGKKITGSIVRIEIL